MIFENTRNRCQSAYYTGCSEKGGTVQHPLNSSFILVFHMFWAFFTIQYGRFSFWYSWGILLKKKSWKIASSKKVKFQGWLKLAIFWIFFFCFFVHNIHPNHAKLKCWGSIVKFRKLQQNGHKNLKIDGEMPKIIEPKVGNPKISISRKWAMSQFEPTLNTRIKNRPYLMVKISPEHGENKKIMDLQGVGLFHPFENTL